MASRPLRRQLDLLRHASSFRLLFSAALGSGIGTWLATIALTVDVYDKTHSASWVSALMIAAFVPTIFVGLALGSMVDRLSRWGLMISADVVRCGIFLALPFIDSALVIVALAGLAGFANAFFRPAVLAGVPNLVADEDVTAANALLVSSEYAAISIGPIAGGALVAAFGTAPAYWLNAATFLLSAALIARIPRTELQSEQSLSRGHLRDIRDGVAVVVGSRPLLTVLAAMNIIVIAQAFINVSEIVLAKVSFHSGSLGFGLLWTGSGIGLIAGSVLCERLVERFGVRRVYPWSLVVFAAGIGAAAISPNVWVAAVFMVVSGLGNGPVVVSNITLVQRGAPDRVRGRAFTLIMSTNFVVLGSALAVAGPLTDAFGARVLYGVSAGALVIAAVVAHLLIRGVGVGDVDEEGVSDALTNVELLPLPAGEAAVGDAPAELTRD